jgi:hypothetical protein
MNAICCLSETKGNTQLYCPPIEIGGYKYVVPNGTVRNICTFNEFNSVKLTIKKPLIIVFKSKGDPSV